MSKSLSIIATDKDELEMYAVGLDTRATIWDEDGYASIKLTYVQAQQLYRWLKERLGE